MSSVSRSAIHSSASAVSMSTTPFVLFVYLHGSAKSVIAIQHFRRRAAERGLAADTASAGTEPDEDIPPGVGRGLREDGIDPDGLRPQAVTRADLERASRVVAFGCDLTPMAPAARRRALGRRARSQRGLRGCPGCHRRPGSEARGRA